MRRGRGSSVGRQSRGGRRPFKSRNNTSSFRRAVLQKRKHESNQESDEENKKFKEDPAAKPSEVNGSSASSESESEEVVTKPDRDSHTMLLQSFGADIALHSEPEEDESDESGSELDSDADSDSDEASANESKEDEDEKNTIHEVRRLHGQQHSQSTAEEDDESDIQTDDESDIQTDDESVVEDDESDVEVDESDISENELSKNDGKELNGSADGVSSESDADSLFCASDDEQLRENKLTASKKNNKKAKKGTPTKAIVINDLDEADHQCLPAQNDPFCTHFERCLSEEAAELLLDPTSWHTECHLWPGFGGAVKHSYPTPPVAVKSKPKLRLTTDPDASPPVYGGPLHPPSDCPDLSLLSIKETVLKNIPDLTDVQKHLLHIISNYRDLYFPSSSHDKWDDTTTVYCTHILNHVLKTRARILKNNAKLSKLKASKAEVDMALFKDQGLSRPKVLVLLPSKHSAYRVVKAMQLLLGLGHKQQVKQLARFEDDYGPGDSNGGLPRALKGRPDDFIATFTGDTSENFKIGITVSSRSLGLYSNFSRSDIILASPLGLRLTAGVEGEDDNNSGFLSSIEILVLDQASCFLMQNWDHVLAVLESINVFVRNVKDIVSDGRRVRPWVVDGHAKLYRQTLMFSGALDDLQRALFSRCCNMAGRLEVLPTSEGVLKDVFVSADLLMLRCPGITDGEARLNYFTQEFFPQHVASRKSFTLLYIPDTSDYYLLSQFLAQERAIDFSSINEYLTSKMSHVAVARSDFFKGTSPLLLYTERFHYYKRPVIKGVRHLIFYALPTFSHFFSEMCNMMMGSLQNQSAPRAQRQLRPSITVLYQRSDVTRLASVMGSKTAKELLTSNKAVHMCSISGT